MADGQNTETGDGPFCLRSSPRLLCGPPFSPALLKIEILAEGVDYPGKARLMPTEVSPKALSISMSSHPSPPPPLASSPFFPFVVCSTRDRNTAPSYTRPDATSRINCQSVRGPRSRKMDQSWRRSEKWKERLEISG